MFVVVSSVIKMEHNMTEGVKVVMHVTMAIPRDGMSWVMSSAVMFMEMAIQEDRVFLVMSSMTKMDNDMNNWMKVVMLVTMAI